MSNLPKITDSEWEIMKVLWKNSPQTSSEIINQLSHEFDWKPTTITTLLTRLVNKKSVGINKETRPFKYYPLPSREECIKDKNRSFLAKVHDGAVKALLVNFLEMEELSDDDINDLKKILSQRKSNKELF